MMLYIGKQIVEPFGILKRTQSFLLFPCLFGQVWQKEEN